MNNINKTITTKKHFEIFKKEVERWIEYFGLKHYRISFEHVFLKDAWGSCSYSLSAGTVTISLARDWGQKIEITQIRKTALLLLRIAQTFSDLGVDGKLYIIGVKVNHKKKECEIHYSNIEEDCIKE